MRCWRSYWEPDLSELERALDRSTADILHVQFNFGFFELHHLASLLESELARRPVVVTLHRSTDALAGDGHVSLAAIRPTLEKVDRVVVHQQRDADILASLGINARVEVVAHGAPRRVVHPDRRELRRALGLGSRPVIATFGFLLPHKGTRELIKAVDIIRRSTPDVLLVSVSAIHPDASSEAYRAECVAEIERRGLAAHVILVTDFLPVAEAHTLLAAADIIAMPYRQTEESASGALRFALGAGRAIAAPNIAIFDDVRDVVAPLHDISADGLAHALIDLLGDPAHLEDLATRAQSFSQRVSWDNVAARHREIYDAVLRNEPRPSETDAVSRDAATTPPARAHD
jgi:glycosyltransferase involved in cell wall biosynthesis